MEKDGVRKGLIVTLSVLGVATIAALATLAVILFSDSFRVKRNLSLAQKYLSNEEYEEAIVHFDKAIEINERCIDAYLGKLDAYEELGDKKDLQNYYDDLLVTMAEWDSDYIEEINDEVSTIVLEAKTVYKDDPLKEFEALEKGLDIIEKDDDVVAEYVNAGLKLSEEYEDNYDYENSLAVYDKLLSKSNDDKVTDALSDCLEIYINQLIYDKEYDKAKEIIAKYSDMDIAFDSDYYLDEIEQLSEYYDTLTDYLTLIAEKCQAEDYDGAFDLMHTDEYEKVINYVDELGEIRAFDTPYGKVGVYIVETISYGNHMIYYGEYDGDMRSGYGVWLAYYEGNNYYAVGEWEDDMPNGYQTSKEWSDALHSSVVYRILDGYTIGGLWDGEVIWTFDRYDGYVYFTPSFDMGYWVVVGTDYGGYDGNTYIYCHEGYDQDGNAVGSLVGDDYENSIVHGIAGFDIYT